MTESLPTFKLNLMIKNPANSGQALLLIVFTMATVLTITMSVVSRSISDVSVSTREEESLRAFSAAEAGVEDVLVSNLGVGQTLDEVVEVVDGEPNVTYSASVSGFPQSSNKYNYPVELAAGESATIWFKSHDEDGNLTCPCFTGSRVDVCFGKRDGSHITPAIEATLLYQNTSGGYETSRVVLDPNASRTPGSIDASGSCNINDGNEVRYRFSEELSFTSGSEFGLSSAERDNMIMMKLRFLYNTDTTQILGVDLSGGDIPSQGKKIESVGESGDSVRKVEVYELYPSLPSIFDTAIFSRSGGLTK